MTNTPQNVTERYVSNLISYGRNKEFDILSIEEQTSKVSDEIVGVYWFAQVVRPVTRENTSACGPTIASAVRRALEKHGVTFR